MKSQRVATPQVSIIIPKGIPSFYDSFSLCLVRLQDRDQTCLEAVAFLEILAYLVPTILADSTSSDSSESSDSASICSLPRAKVVSPKVERVLKELGGKSLVSSLIGGTVLQPAKKPQSLDSESDCFKGAPVTTHGHSPEDLSSTTIRPQHSTIEVPFNVTRFFAIENPEKARSIAKKYFPGPAELFYFHVARAREEGSAPASGRGQSTTWESLRDCQRNDWHVVHTELLETNSRRAAGTAGRKLLTRHGLFPAVQAHNCEVQDRNVNAAQQMPDQRAVSRKEAAAVCSVGTSQLKSGTATSWRTYRTQTDMPPPIRRGSITSPQKPNQSKVDNRFAKRNNDGQDTAQSTSEETEGSDLEYVPRSGGAARRDGFPLYIPWTNEERRTLLMAGQTRR